MSEKHPARTDGPFVTKLVVATLVGGVSFYLVYRWFSEIIALEASVAETVAAVAALLVLIGAIVLLVRTLREP